MTKERLKGEVGRQIAAQSPMNRVATTQEVAEATYLLASGNMWMTGSIIDVNGASYLRT
jgi:NAD(P)-dependent dehydrogenase (short-subunit alcohol dehydrogenase family)